MEMYTELVMEARLKCTTPSNIINILYYMVGEYDNCPEDLPDHPLFGTERWEFMLDMGSCYFVGDTYAKLLSRPYVCVTVWDLTVRCNLKNYDNEIELFLDWICPYLDSSCHGFIGYFRYEEYDDPTLIYYDSDVRGGQIQLMNIVEGCICEKIPLSEWLDRLK